MNHTALIFDTETTGREASTIIEAAWLSIRDLATMGIQADFQRYFNPAPVQIEFGAMATHHILPHELHDAPASSTFALPDGLQYLVGHNIDFDWEVSGKPDVRRICTLALSRWLWPDLDGHSQSALYYWIASKRGPSTLEKARETLRNAHSALYDVRICYEILLEELSELERRGTVVTDWDHLWRLSEEARIPTVMSFGKHKGEKISAVPRSYMQWYMRQDEQDPYVVKAFVRASGGSVR